MCPWRLTSFDPVTIAWYIVVIWFGVVYGNILLLFPNLFPSLPSTAIAPPSHHSSCLRPLLHLPPLQEIAIVMSAFSDHEAITTWYQPSHFSSAFGVFKILSLTVVPAIRKILVGLELQDRSLEFNFVLYRDRRGSPQKCQCYIVVLVFNLNDDFAFKLRIRWRSDGGFRTKPRILLKPSGTSSTPFRSPTDSFEAIRDVDTIQISCVSPSASLFYALPAPYSATSRSSTRRHADTLLFLD
ncbi:hypothetical protein BDZ97DRAFT_1771555 [Flammula alnicola]|nr:hypothetical protein BDZ97DRAFT_1771555 [Flammula alnicola]